MWIVNQLTRSLARKLVPPEVEFFASGVAGRRQFMALQPGDPALFKGMLNICLWLIVLL
jgi:hypothetical protein